MTILSEIMEISGGGIITLVGGGGKTTFMFRLARELSLVDGPVLTTTTTKIYMPRPEESETVIISDNLENVVSRCRDALKTTRHITAVAGHLQDKNKLTGFQADHVDRLWDTGMFRWIIAEADGALRKPLKVPASHEPVVPGKTRYMVALVGLDAMGKPLDEQWVFRSALYSEVTGLAMGATVDESSVVRALLHDQGLMKGCPDGAVRYVFLNKADDEGRRQSGRRVAELLRLEKTRRPDGVFVGSLQGDLQDIESFYMNGEADT